MPRARRHEPLHLQIANHYKELITTGELQSGERLPSIRAIVEEWEVGQNTAQRAIDHLKAEGLVRTTPEGTFVDADRVKRGPQQKSREVQFGHAERIEMRAAEIIESPEYVIPILGLTPAADGVTRVLRREWVTYEKGDEPFMLSVSWCPTDAAEHVPELLSLWPLPSPGGAARLIAERTGREITYGHTWREARQVKDDKREGPLLRVPKNAFCLAETYVWSCGDDVIEYGEYVVIPDRVIESDMEP